MGGSALSFQRHPVDLVVRSDGTSLVPPEGRITSFMMHYLRELQQGRLEAF
jgi:hypothetical protein